MVNTDKSKSGASEASVTELEESKLEEINGGIVTQDLQDWVKRSRPKAGEFDGKGNDIVSDKGGTSKKQQG